MKGLELAKKYYFEIGRPAIERELPEVLPLLAAGLCGDGSDVLGYDDEFSADHDFGPGFCLWLDDNVYEQYGERLQQIYDSLPGAFAGSAARENTSEAGKRVGVFRLGSFFEQFTGSSLPPETVADWAKPEEPRLAQITGGAVFEDGPGIFTAFRDILAGYYPEPLRIDRILSEVHLVSQSGQYNYARCMERGDVMAANICLHEFLRHTIHLVHLLDRKYEPYYKWRWRSFTELPDAKSMVRPLTHLSELPPSVDAWTGSHGQDLNYKDEKVLLIETVCRDLVAVLKDQGLTDRNDSFLEAHLGTIATHLR